MIQCLTTTTTHNALVDEVKAPKLQVISRDDPIPCSCPNKEKDTSGCLNLSNADIIISILIYINKSFVLKRKKKKKISKSFLKRVK